MKSITGTIGGAPSAGAVTKLFPWIKKEALPRLATPSKGFSLKV
ncbi:hypothetical protein [Enterococcus faecium]